MDLCFPTLSRDTENYPRELYITPSVNEVKVYKNGRFMRLVLRQRSTGPSHDHNRDFDFTSIIPQWGSYHIDSNVCRFFITAWTVFRHVISIKTSLLFNNIDEDEEDIISKEEVDLWVNEYSLAFSIPQIFYTFCDFMESGVRIESRDDFMNKEVSVFEINGMMHVLYNSCEFSFSPQAMTCVDTEDLVEWVIYYLHLDDTSLYNFLNLNNPPWGDKDIVEWIKE